MLHAWYLVGSAHFALYYSVKFQFYDIFISNIFRKPHCSISSHAECTKQQRARTSALVASIHMHIAYMHTTHTYIYIMMRPPMAGHRQQLNFWVIYINAFERWKYVDYLFVWNEFLGRACLNVDSFSFRCGLFCYFFFFVSSPPFVRLAAVAATTNTQTKDTQRNVDGMVTESS